MRWSKEPLLQFLLIGAVIFAGYAWLQPPAAEQILVPSHLDAQQREQFINETVLVREAQKLGLDKNDSIINRQLQQKMRNLLEATADSEVTDTELKKWIHRQPERYGTPPTVDLVHRLFRRSQHSNAYQAAAIALREGDANLATTDGDIETLIAISQRELRRRYGESFAIAVFSEWDKQWHGPVNSGLGSHIFKIISQNPGAAPDFEKVRKRALRDWIVEQETKAFVEGLAERRRAYDLVEQP